MRLILLPLLLASAAAEAGHVAPQLGGGSPGGVGASMKHADVYLPSFGPPQVVVEIDASVALPRLRPLLPGDTFDPAADWSVLSGYAHNAQYGWNPGGFIRLPAGASFWVESLGSSEGLKVYQAPPESPGYAPIFGTDGSPTRWEWETTQMVHNYYAATDITHTTHWAAYRVYLGDSVTGEPLAGYAAAEVRFDFAPPGDFNADGSIDAADAAVWAGAFGQTGPNLAADADGDGRVDAADYTVWRDAMASPGNATAAPEPTAAVLALLALVGARSGRRPTAR